MTKPILLLGLSMLSSPLTLNGQGLEQAEVRISYGELKQLLARAAPPTKSATPKPALLSARLRFSIELGQPVIDATFRIIGFSDDITPLPFLSGDLTLEKQEPEDAAITATGESLCLMVNQPGTIALRLRLLPIQTGNSFSFSLPPCPSAIFETGDLPADQSVVLASDGTEETLSAGQIRALPHGRMPMTLRILDGNESREASLPPAPSTWTWQQQALVRPLDGELNYHVIARASATDGSGVEALLQLPPDAQDVTVMGDDLISQTIVRESNRSSGISLIWKTRGILDRQVTIHYRMPLRPLDRIWHLHAPGGDGTRTRFIIAASPLLAYSAEKLTDPLTSQGLPNVLAELLKGAPCQHLEAGSTADIAVMPIPVAATAEGVVTKAEWALKIEPDGAMLVTGILSIEHKNPLGFIFDTPDDMKLLSCEVGGRPVSPVDTGGGTMKVALTPTGENSRLVCAFTGHAKPLDPVEGTMRLSLPKVPLFIHSIQWQLDLPSGYQAETHGNLKRVQAAGETTPFRITLNKNLCRDERPEVHVFYQRSDLNH